MNSKAFLTKKIEEEILLYYKSLDKVDCAIITSVAERWSDDSLNSEKGRFSELNHYLGDATNKSILDMSSGCGSFVLQGLREGWDVHGIEPEQWKQDLIDLKFKENDYPTEWRERIKQGIGEELPYSNEQFDAFNSWQTFEHVQNVDDCLRELYRVLKPNGKGIIHCPSYMTFYEGHYRMFWLPMLGNSAFGRFYVKLMGRPTTGLKTFVPITQGSLTRKAKAAGFAVESIPKKEIYAAGKRKLSFLNGGLGTIFLPILYFGWRTIKGIKRFGRNEKSIHLLLTKTK